MLLDVVRCLMDQVGAAAPGGGRASIVPKVDAAFGGDTALVQVPSAMPLACGNTDTRMHRLAVERPLNAARARPVCRGVHVGASDVRELSVARGRHGRCVLVEPRSSPGVRRLRDRVAEFTSWLALPGIDSGSGAISDYLSASLLHGPGGLLRRKGARSSQRSAFGGESSRVAPFRGRCLRRRWSLCFGGRRRGPASWHSTCSFARVRAAGEHARSAGEIAFGDVAGRYGAPTRAPR